MTTSHTRHLLCSTEQIPPGQCKGFELSLAQRRLEMFVVNQAGSYHAYVNKCPHTGVTLNWQPDQFLDYENVFIQCSTHGALFKIETGLCIRGPCVGFSLDKLALQEEHGELYLSLPSKQDE